jgi:hypothetical protein
MLISSNHTDIFDTPPTARGSKVTDSILQVTNHIDNDNDNDDDEPTAKRGRYLKFTTEQLSQLIVACSSKVNQQLLSPTSSPMSVISNQSTAPAFVTNAKYEDICCWHIKPLYNRTEKDLMPFLIKP